MHLLIMLRGECWPPPTATKQLDLRTDAQRVAEEKRRKEKDIELLAFNSTEDVEGASVAEEAQVSRAFRANIFSNPVAIIFHLKDPLIRRMKGADTHLTMATILPSPTPSRLSHKFQLWMATWTFGAKKIDVLSRSFFPFCFATFNMSYWYFYLSQQKREVEK